MRSAPTRLAGTAATRHDDRVATSEQTEGDISIADAPDQHRYELRDGDKVIGQLAYRRPDDEHIDLVHTEVDKEYGGRGLASRLVAEAIDDANSRGLRVIPHCEYVQAWLRKHPDADVQVDWPDAD